jgi:dihydrofolate synthase/folylpolyglutamate synthase
LVDGAHNADAMETLVESVQEEYPTTRWHVVLGVMGDKNVQLILERLAPIAKGMVTTAVDYKRAMPAAERAAVASSTLPDIPVLAADNVADAVDMARAESGPGGAVLVTGSLYLVGEVRDLLT